MGYIKNRETFLRSSALKDKAKNKLIGGKHSIKIFFLKTGDAKKYFYSAGDIYGEKSMHRIYDG